MDSIFSGLSLVIVVGALVALIMRLIGQPLIIGHILTGIIVGPAVLHITKNPEALKIFSDLGIALLLFIIGLGLNPKTVKEVGKAATSVAVVQVCFITALGYIIGTALGLTRTSAAFLGASLAISSTIIILKVLSDKKEQSRLYGKIAISVSLVQDIIAIVLVVVTSARGGGSLEWGPVLSLAFKALIIGYLIYMVSSEILPRFNRLISGSQEFLFLFAIAWGLGSATLFSKVGLSSEIGALLAGICLAPQPYAPEIASRLRPLRDFFVIVFFITLGATLSLTNFSGSVPIIIAAILIAVVAKPLVSMVILGFLGYTKRTSFKASVALAQVSEFSIVLVILGQNRGLLDGRFVSAITFIALISIAVSAYLMTFSDRIYGYVEKHLGMFERRKLEGVVLPKERNDLVLFGYQRGGHEFVNLFKKMKKPYVVIDYDPEVIDVIEHRKINYLYGDATDVEMLEEAGVEHAKLVVSTIPEYDVNEVILNFLKSKNPNAIAIMHGDDPYEAAKLYEAGASYVILPHYIGSEKVSEFIAKSGLAKSTFRKQRVKHLGYLEKHYGAVEKLSQINERRLGRALVHRVASLNRP